jgi:hypothetical protein
MLQVLQGDDERQNSIRRIGIDGGYRVLAGGIDKDSVNDFAWFD